MMMIDCSSRIYAENEECSLLINSNKIELRERERGRERERKWE